MNAQFWVGAIVGFVAAIAAFVGLFLYITREPESYDYERPA
jgi:hypothetical protein